MARARAKVRARAKAERGLLTFLDSVDLARHGERHWRLQQREVELGADRLEIRLEIRLEMRRGAA